MSSTALKAVARHLSDLLDVKYTEALRLAEQAVARLDDPLSNPHRLTIAELVDPEQGWRRLRSMNGFDPVASLLPATAHPHWQRLGFDDVDAHLAQILDLRLGFVTAHPYERQPGGHGPVPASTPRSAFATALHLKAHGSYKRWADQHPDTIAALNPEDAAAYSVDRVFAPHPASFPNEAIGVAFYQWARDHLDQIEPDETLGLHRPLSGLAWADHVFDFRSGHLLGPTGRTGTVIPLGTEGTPALPADRAPGAKVGRFTVETRDHGPVTVTSYLDLLKPQGGRARAARLVTSATTYVLTTVFRLEATGTTYACVESGRAGTRARAPLATRLADPADRHGFTLPPTFLYVATDPTACLRTGQPMAQAYPRGTAYLVNRLVTALSDSTASTGVAVHSAEQSARTVLADAVTVLPDRRTMPYFEGAGPLYLYRTIEEGWDLDDREDVRWLSHIWNTEDACLRLRIDYDFRPLRASGMSYSRFAELMAQFTDESRDYYDDLDDTENTDEGGFYARLYGGIDVPTAGWPDLTARWEEFLQRHGVDRPAPPHG